MKKNLGRVDKAIRFLMALIIGVLYFSGTLSGIWAIGLMIIAVVFITTSFVGSCPLYLAFGISTRK